MSDSIINILLIEDNPGDVHSLQMMLGTAQPSRFDLVSFPRLAEGLAHLASDENRIDIILLDLNLPDSQGFETVAQIQLHAPQIPIIVLTGIDNEQLATQVVRAGGQD